MQRDYSHGSYGDQNQSSNFPNSSFGMENADDRFGPYESYDSRSSLGERDLFRSGYGYNEPEQSRFGDSFDDGYKNSYRNSLDSFGGRNQGGSSWDAPYSRSQMRPGFMDDRGRESYSSYGSFSSSLMKPAPAGSRGRGMPAYPEGAFGGRSFDAFGGQPSGRGRGRGQMGEFGGVFRPGFNNQFRGGAAGRGMKRKGNPPGDKPAETGKKAKLAKQGATIVNNASNKKAGNDEEEEKRKIEARREKQRRRREKNNEKYGDGYRMAFTCSFCKYRTFEEKDIEAHLGSSTHQETLDHIQKQTKFDKLTMEFLHECMVNKLKKTSMRKAQTIQNEASNNVQKNMMEGITDEDHMMKVETVHCSACSVYVPALYSSVQQHLKSPDHAKSKLAFKEQVKKESVLTATSILNNPVVKARYELFAKGENPFEIVEQPQEPVVEENETQETNADFSEEAAGDSTEETSNFVEEPSTFVEDTGTAEYAEDAADFAEDPTDQIDFTADYVTTEEN